MASTESHKRTRRQRATRRWRGASDEKTTKTRPQVMYVWIDALTNYVTGAGGLGEHNGKDFAKGGGRWPADCHVIGKDIVRFHAIYWPAFLMSAELPLPVSYTHLTLPTILRV